MIYDVSDIGRNIKRLRKAAGLMQYDLAEMIGVEYAGSISVYETGKAVPGGETLIKLAGALECSMEDLFCKSDCETTS